MEKLEGVIFYTLEKTIKSYRQFAQKEIKIAGYSITIDQWLILKTLQEYPAIEQQQLSRKVFKDVASITRILDILVRSGFIDRSINEKDRRRRCLSLTEKGRRTMEKVHEIVIANRNTALNGISRRKLEVLKEELEKIMNNCS